MEEDDTDDPLTPRESCSLQRAPIFAGRARIAMSRLEIGRLRYLGATSPHEVNLDKARACSKLIRELQTMATRFEGWTSKDPGVDARVGAAHRLRDIELQLEALIPADWA